MPGNRSSHPLFATGHILARVRLDRRVARHMAGQARRMHQRRARTRQILHACGTSYTSAPPPPAAGSANAPCTPSAPRPCIPSRAPASADPAPSAIRRSPPAPASPPRTSRSRDAAPDRAASAARCTARARTRPALRFFSSRMKSRKYCNVRALLIEIERVNPILHAARGSAPAAVTRSIPATRSTSHARSLPFSLILIASTPL